MISKYLNPKNDTAFKRIFGEERNKDIVISLINSVLHKQFNDRKIVDIEFLKTDQVAETAAAKSSSVDVMCKDQDGNRYIVEMQVTKQAGFEKRAQYYASKAYIDQMPKGGDWEELKKIIFIAFADYPIFDYKKSYKTDHVILDRETYDHDLEDFSFTFINLPKFMEKYPNSIPASLEEKFYYFLCKADELTAHQVKELANSEQMIGRAFEELDIINWPDEARRAYEKTENIERNYRANMAGAKQEGEKIGHKKGKEEGEKIGHKKGKEEGREEGEKIGIEKGKKETLDELVKQGVITQEQADAMLKN